MSKRSTSPPPSRQLLLAMALIALFSGGVLAYRVPRETFHGDEAGWITSSYYYLDLLTSRNWQADAWRGSKNMFSAWGWPNPPLSRWLLGLSLKPYELQTGHRFEKMYDFNVSREENARQGNIPPREILLAARLVPAAFGVLCCLLILLIGHYAYHLSAGALAAALTAVNPLFFCYCSRAMTDAFYIFFLLAFLLLQTLLLRASRQRDALGLAFLAGLMTGGAASIKVTGFPLCLLTFLAVWFYWKRGAKIAIRPALAVFGLFLVGFLMVLFGTNPYLWQIGVAPPSAVSAPGGGPIAALPRQARWLISQVPGGEGAVQFARTYAYWSSYMDWLRAQGKGGWEQSRLQEIHHALFQRFDTFPGEGLLTAAALAGLLPLYLRMALGRRYDPLFALATFFLVNYSFLLIFLKLNWPRYYLITVLSARLLLAVAVAMLLSYLFAKKLPKETSSQKIS